MNTRTGLLGMKMTGRVALVFAVGIMMAARGNVLVAPSFGARAAAVAVRPDSEPSRRIDGLPLPFASRSASSHASTSSARTAPGEVHGEFAELEPQILANLLVGKNIEAQAAALRAARQNQTAQPRYLSDARVGPDADAEARLSAKLAAFNRVLSDTTPVRLAQRKVEMNAAANAAQAAMFGAEAALMTKRDDLVANGHNGAAARLTAALSYFVRQRTILLASITQAKASMDKAVIAPSAKVSMSFPVLDAALLAASAAPLERSLGLRALPILRPSFAARAPVEAPTIDPVYARDRAPYLLASAADLLIAPDRFRASNGSVQPDVGLAGSNSSNGLFPPRCDGSPAFLLQMTYAIPGTLIEPGYDLKLATYLIQKLRACGYPARYEFGVVEFPVAKLTPMLGLSDPAQQALALARAGIAARPILAAGAVTAFALEHTFVAALIPFDSISGTARTDTGRQWIAMMPAVKPYEYRASTVLARTNFDASAFVASYLRKTPAQLGTSSPLDVAQLALQQLLLGTAPPILADLTASRVMTLPNLGAVPSSLPLKVLAVTSEFTEVPPDLQTQMQLQMRATVAENSALILNYTGPAQSLVLAYQAAGEDDQDIINAYGSLSQTPPYLVRLRPVLKRGDRIVAVGVGDIASGVAHRVEIELRAPGGAVRSSQQLLSGGFAVLSLSNDDVTQSSDAARIMTFVGAEYWRRLRDIEDEFASLFGVNVIRPLPSAALVILEFKARQNLGLVSALDFQGVSFDALLHPVEPMAATASAGTPNATAAWMQLAALAASALEHQVLKQQLQVDSISADKAFSLATEQNIPIRTARVAADLFAIALPEPIRAELFEQLATGRQIEITERSITRNAWRGFAWRVFDPNDVSGDTGYFITSSYAGGGTTEPPPSWLLQDLLDILRAPYVPAPNTDPTAAASVEKIGASDEQVGSVNETLDRPLAVVVLDASNRPVKGALVNFAIQSTQGVLTGDAGSSGLTATALSDRFGVASVSLKLGTKTDQHPFLYFANPGDEFQTQAELYQIDAGVGTIAGVIRLPAPLTALAKPGTSVKLMLQRELPNASPQASHTELGFVSVAALDAFNNGVANATVKFNATDATGYSCAGASQLHFYIFQQACDGLTGSALYACAEPSKQRKTSVTGTSIQVVTGMTVGGTQNMEITLSGAPTLTQSVQMEAAPDGSNDPNYCRFGKFGVTNLRPSDEEGFVVYAAANTQPAAAKHTQTFWQQRGANMGMPPAPIEAISPTLVPINSLSGGATLIGPDLFAPGVFNWSHIGASGAATGYIDHKIIRSPDEWRALLSDVNYPIGGNTVLVVELKGITGGFGANGAPVSDGFNSIINGGYLIARVIPFPTVEIAALNTVPSETSLSTSGFPTQDIQLRFRYGITEPNYRARVGARLFENGTLIQTVLSAAPKLSGSGAASVSLPRIRKLDLRKTYSAEIVLNPLYSGGIKSNTIPVPLSAPLVKGFALWKAGEQPRIRGSFAPQTSITTEIDVPNQYVCVSPVSFGVELGQEANVRLEATPLDSFGVPSGPSYGLFGGELLPAGITTRSIAAGDLKPGSYQIKITAISTPTPNQGAITETYTGNLDHRINRRDVLPLAHAFTKDVDLFDGGFVAQRSDANLPGRGPGLKFIRTYTSHAGEQLGALGKGWTSNYDSTVETDPCGQVILTGVEGQGMRFSRDNAASTGDLTVYKPLYGYHGSLTNNTQGWDFYPKNGTRVHLDSMDLGLTRVRFISDTNGNRVTLNWSLNQGQALLTSAVDSAGRSLVFSYDGIARGTLRSGAFGVQPLLKSMAGPGGLQLNYSYDAAGKLLAAERVGAGGTKETYDYLDLGLVAYPSIDGRTLYEKVGPRLSAITNRLDGGVRRMSFQTNVETVYGLNLPFNALVVRVNTLTEPDAGRTVFVYEGARGSTGAVSTKVTDARLSDSLYEMNRYGAVTRQTGPAGTRLTTWNSAAAQPASETDVLGATHSYSYDTNGNRTLDRVNYAGITYDQTWVYKLANEFGADSFIKDRLASSVDQRGIASSYSYDARGNLTGHTLAGDSESFSVAANGDVTAHTDFRGNRSTQSYDAYGLAAIMTDALGGIANTDFDVRGRLIRMTDVNRHTETYGYDQRDRRIGVNYADGTTATSVYEDTNNTQTDTDALSRSTIQKFDLMGRLLSKTDALNHSMTYVPDKNGNVTSMTDYRGNVTTQTFNGANFMVSKTEPDTKVSAYTVDGLGHVLSETTTGVGGSRTTTREYQDPSYQITAETRVGTSAGSLRMTFGYDGNGNKTRQTDAKSQPTTVTYDHFDRALVTTEPLSKLTTLARDANGNVLTETITRGAALGSTVTTKSYDALNRMISMTDAVGQISSMRYDAVGNTLSVSNARTGTVASSYDARNRKLSDSGPEVPMNAAYAYDLVGNLVTETHGNGQVITHGYDALNRRNLTKDGIGNITRTTFDENGNVLTQSDGNGHVSSFTYNDLNQKVTASYPELRGISLTPNAWGDTLSERDARGNATSFSVDAAGWQTRITRPGVPASVTNLSYDANGNVVEETDARGFVTTHLYDALNRKIRTTYPDVGAGVQIESWNYDLLGNVVSHIDRNGVSEGFAYDKESRLLASSRAGVTTAQRTLDAVGNTISITDANNNTTRTKYDLANRPLEVTAANGDITKTTYDAVGNKLTITDGAGRTTTFVYDKRSRKLSETNSAGEKTEYSYDGAGNLLTTKKPIGTWTYTYDAADRVIAVLTPDQHTTTYSYDKNNNRTVVKNANQNPTTMSYSARNQLESMVYPNSQAESYRYDANDNRIGRTDANAVDHTMMFDAWNRLKSQAAPTSIATQVASSVFGYDANSNLLSTVETLGDGSLKSELNQYDARDRLIQTTDRNSRVLKYGYDPASNQTSYTDSDGVTTERTFDRKNRLVKTLRATLGAVVLAYSGADELKTITHPNGTETNRTYDQAGRLASITVSQGAVTVSQRVYTFDANGNRLTQVEKNGGAAETSTYEYDLDNRLTKVIGPDQTETYTIDAAGNRKTEVVKNLANVVLANKTYSYNSREQLLSVADGANTTTYLYDGNGNQNSVKVGSALAKIYTWGPRDQLASLSTGEAFEYDSAGHRTAKTSGGNRTLYIWSSDQMMGETNTIGNSLSQVVRVGSLLLGEVRGGIAQHFDQDAFNSVIVTTLADGTIPGRLSYRAFGQIRSQTGLINSPFRFNGYIDDGNGELSSPARYYASALGRFTSMDPAKMDPMNPITGNPFVGLNSNPMVNIDPTGKYAEAGHYYTTYLVARETGYSHQEALTLALYSQLPDEIGTFDAIHQPVRGVVSMPGALWDAFGSGLAGEASTPPRFYNTNLVQPEFHAITGGFSAPERALSAASVINAPDLETAGLAIHRLGDTFAHSVIGNEDHLYATGLGHLGDWHDPDLISARPNLYRDYVATLVDTLAARNGNAMTPKKRAEILARVTGLIDGPIKAREQRIQAALVDSQSTVQAIISGGDVTPEMEAASYRYASAVREFQSTDDEILAAMKARAKNFPNVVVENNSGAGSVLLAPELADGSVFDAQGQEFENAMNFLDKANPIPIDDPLRKRTEPGQANKLIENLNSSALKLLETQKRCRRGDCQ